MVTVSEFNARYSEIRNGLLKLSQSEILCIQQLAMSYLGVLADMYKFATNTPENIQASIDGVRTKTLGVLTFSELEQFVNTNEKVLAQIKKCSVVA